MSVTKDRILSFRVKTKEKILYKELAAKLDMKPSELFRNWLQKELKKEKLL